MGKVKPKVSKRDMELEVDLTQDIIKDIETVATEMEAVAKLEPWFTTEELVVALLHIGVEEYWRRKLRYISVKLR